jgi:transcriptional regulator with XRE-family HTH domain
VAHKQIASPFPSVRRLRLPASVTAPRAPATPVRSLCASRIGAQIKALRIASGVSGGQLAQHTGLSASMLSRVERGLVSPSVETLERIASGLGVAVSRFFSEGSGRADFSHVPAGKGLRVDCAGAMEGYGYELLGRLQSRELAVEPCLMHLAQGARPDTASQHPGLTFLYVLSGRLSYRYGTKVVEVGPGDSLLFEAGAPHGVDGFAESPVVCLCAVFSLRD